ncbi:PEP-CTERM sorting domain-containing protein [Pseudoduganella sp. SL102]|uniref:PEP-CTERM sorting domain-containing protein n=1 Tax=Pseudoduganella sp. SL102 TaxID=2995154 RepID=UPI00248B22AE|nr:PEP-CTERM sorting domain-containing protein [Pseudoduganella sp. SL102]WBS03408.1 PEP-CTERM sorting domain-containing protein [Pseudoduganella sp. SL102]
MKPCFSSATHCIRIFRAFARRLARIWTAAQGGTLRAFLPSETVHVGCTAVLAAVLLSSAAPAAGVVRDGRFSRTVEISVSKVDPNGPEPGITFNAFLPYGSLFAHVCYTNGICDLRTEDLYTIDLLPNQISVSAYGNNATAQMDAAFGTSHVVHAEHLEPGYSVATVYSTAGLLFDVLPNTAVVLSAHVSGALDGALPGYTVSGFSALYSFITVDGLVVDRGEYIGMLGQDPLMFDETVSVSFQSGSEHQILRWDLTDGASVAIAAAIPEPSTYAMLLAGLVTLGVSLGRGTSRGRPWSRP